MKQEFTDNGTHGAARSGKPSGPDRGGRRMWMAWTLMVAGLSLVGAAFCVPPTGMIDSSVLVAFGEILTFTATVMGLDYKFRR